MMIRKQTPQQRNSVLYRKQYAAKVQTNLTRPYKRPRYTTPAARFSQIPRAMPEIKALDIPDGAVALNSTGAIAVLNTIRAGSSFFNRIGRKINLKSLRCNFYVAPIRAQNAIDYVRIMLIYDKQANGAFPTIADIIQSTDQAGTNSTTNMSNANLNNRDRFKILRDQRITLAAVAAGPPLQPTNMFDQVSPNTNIEWFVKLGGMETQFRADSAPAVIGDIATGALLLVTLGDFALGVEGYEMRVESRLRYWDV